jgi:hypothetical protein
VRDVFQAVLDSGNLLCVRQGELLRVSTAERIVKDEKVRTDAIVAGATRDVYAKAAEDVARTAVAKAAIDRAEQEGLQKTAELLTKRGEIKQEIIRLRYADAGVLAKTVAAMVGIGANVPVASCRVRKQDDKIAVEALDQQGGGGISLAAEQQREIIALTRATNPFATGLGPTQPGSQAQPPGAVVGPPGGLGAFPPFSSLFGPQPVVPVVPGETQLGGGFQGTLKGVENTPLVRTDCPTNSLVLRLYDDQLVRVREAIERQLDVTPHQIKIESRIENLNREDLFAIGVQWGGGGLVGINNRTEVLRPARQAPRGSHRLPASEALLTRTSRWGQSFRWIRRRGSRQRRPLRRAPPATWSTCPLGPSLSQRRRRAAEVSRSVLSAAG